VFCKEKEEEGEPHALLHFYWRLWDERLGTDLSGWLSVFIV
jgi:hypothetical protein